jgi:hypothetical protein
MKQTKIQRSIVSRTADRRESFMRIITTYLDSSPIHWDKWHFQIAAYLRCELDCFSKEISKRWGEPAGLPRRPGRGVATFGNFF